MLALFLTVALVQIVALMSPGPDFFFISQTAARKTRGDAFKGVAGITLAVAIWAALGLLGLNFLLVRMGWLHKAIITGGGLYLLWMGLKLLKSSMRKNVATGMRDDNAPPSVRKENFFIRGLLTNLSNPKVVIYFGSVFSLFAGDDMSSAARVGIYMLTLVETGLWFSLVAIAFSQPWMREKYQRLARWVDGAAGALFTAFGLHLIVF